MNAGQRTTRGRVLVVDDNRAIHDDFRKIIGVGARGGDDLSLAETALFGDTQAVGGTRPEFDVDSAYQGTEGLEMIRRARDEGRPYALAFVDVRMPPGLDGIETTARIWDHDPEIQIVICTAYSDYSWSDTLAKLGHSDRLVILKKPFDTVEVMQLACALTEKWNLGRQTRSMLEDLELRVASRTQELVLAGEKLQASEAQYRMLFDSNPHPMWVYDLETLRFSAVNGAATAHYGYSREQFLGMTIRDIRLAADVPALEKSVREAVVKGRGFGTARHCKRDGSLIDVEISSDGIVFDGRAARLVLAHDVTERLKAEVNIRRLNRVHAVLSSINGLIVRMRDRDELFRNACRIAVEAGGFRMAMITIIERGTTTMVPVASAGMSEEILSLHKRVLSSPESASTTMIARAIRSKAAIVSNDAQQDPRIAFRGQYAECGVRSIALFPLTVADEVVGAFALYSGEIEFFQEDELKLLTELAADVSFSIDHIEKADKLDYLAFYDDVTGLANRRLFLERVAEQLRGDFGGERQLALFVIDLERFKNINDSFGRAAGDSLLRQVAEWLTLQTGDVNRVARVGADHFAVVMPHVSSDASVARHIEKTLEAFLDHSFRLQDGVFRIAVKIGVALFPADGDSAEILFRNAEAALKKAKARGERYMLYTPNMTESAAGRLTMESRLRQALVKEEFVLHYQPKVNLQTGKLTGAEALIRWEDPRGGLVQPGQFIQVLEETGLIHQVGRWALHRAVADYLRWRNAGAKPFRIAVNVSPLQLRDQGFIDEIGRAIGVDPRAPAGLELEITESVIMEDVKRTIASLQAIRDMGVTLAIDDFGTGFSSLSYLSRLPVDTLKIDRAFVTEMTAGPQGLAFISTIINLAHSLKLKVVAEGVETEEQSRLLRLLGCDEMQGYLFGRAVAGAVFEERYLAPDRSSPATMVAVMAH